MAYANFDTPAIHGTPAVLEILSRCGGPKAGRRELTSIASPPRMGDKLITAIMTALDEQTVTVPDTTAADTVLPPPRGQPENCSPATKSVAGQVEGILDAHPLAGSAASILLEVGDATSFSPLDTWPPTPASRPSLAPPAPASKANTQPAPATTNERFFLAVFAALSDPVSRAYHDRKELRPRTTTPLRRPVRHAPRQTYYRPTPRTA